MKTTPPATAAYIAAAEYASDPTLPPTHTAAAEAMRDAARAVWLASDEARDWWVDESDDTLFAICPSEIEEHLSDDCRLYAEQKDATMFITASASPIDPVTDEPLDGECVEVAVTIEPEAPDCTGAAHDWRSPEMLGGLPENPGVEGHGGGVIVTEVCSHCGKYMTTDTWAQNRATGEQGLTSVEYTPADERSEQWIADRDAR